MFSTGSSGGPHHDTKHQAPNSKHQTSTTFQYPSTKPFGHWSLVLGICLEFDAWDLVIALGR